MHTRPNTLIVAALLSLLFTAGHVVASGSSSKSDEDDAATQQKKATAEYNKGVAHLDKARAIGLKGDSAFAYNYRATSDAKARKEFEKAAERFENAIKLNPSMKEAHNNLGYTCRKLGKLDESLAAYRAALKLDGSFARAREYLGETFLAMNMPDSAQTQLAILQKAESAYADTLGFAIEKYKLEQIDRKMKEGN